MNPVLILTHNCLELTKRCVESVRNQDVETSVWAIDNGSTDGTFDWLVEENLFLDGSNLNNGVSKGWNRGLQVLFDEWRDNDHVLICGNDTILPRYCYSALLSANAPFVTGVDVGMTPLPEKPDVFPLSAHPDFSCFLIRRECWEKVGPFDERMVSYASDCDYHVRAHRLGIPLWKASVPYQHERSSTMRNADPEERSRLYRQADQDREVFKSLYNCLPGTKEYEKLFLEVPK